MLEYVIFGIGSTFAFVMIVILFKFYFLMKDKHDFDKNKACEDRQRLLEDKRGLICGKICEWGESIEAKQ